MASIQEKLKLTDEEWAALEIPEFLRRPARVERQEAANRAAATALGAPRRKQVPRRKSSNTQT